MSLHAYCEENGEQRGCGIALQFLVDFFASTVAMYGEVNWPGRSKKKKNDASSRPGVGGREQKKKTTGHGDDWFSDVDLLVGVFLQTTGTFVVGARAWRGVVAVRPKIGWRFWD